MIQGNVRGLLSYDKTKILTLERLANLNNSVAIMLTETHLSIDIEDSEVNINGWNVLRGDRSNRKCGGSIIYTKDGLTVANESNFSNDYCDVVAVYISNRNIAMISVYRPPSCPTAKFSEVISYMEKWLSVKFEIFRRLEL